MPRRARTGTGSFDRYSGTLNGLFNFGNPPNTTPLFLSCSGAVVSSASAGARSTRPSRSLNLLPKKKKKA